MKILAIDPGPVESGWALYERNAVGGRIIATGVLPTENLLEFVRGETRDPLGAHYVAIEMIASYGMPVGREVFETCVWIGRLMQAAACPDDVVRVTRNEVKVHLCRSAKAKDANIRQALLDRFGPQGTKKAPGPLYGVKSHAWAALAVAVTVADMLEANREAA